MAEYEYKGPQPAVGDDGELVHPGDVREFGEPPDCPPWELVPGQEPESPPPAAPAGRLAETPPGLAAQGILARGIEAHKPEGM